MEYDKEESFVNLKRFSDNYEEIEPRKKLIQPNVHQTQKEVELFSQFLWRCEVEEFSEIWCDKTKNLRILRPIPPEEFHFIGDVVEYPDLSLFFI